MGGDRSIPWLRPALLLALVAIAARWQTWGNPAIGFDEQYYLLVGDRLFHGALPYVDVWDRKPVGLFLIFAAIRVLGGDGVLQYQLVAALTAWATALAIHRGARGGAGGLAAGVAYLLWLNFVEGEGGQAAVFYNLPMIGAALLVRRAVEARAPPRWIGGAAMLLVGLALQIKYSVVFEGAFFGLALLWSGWRRGAGVGGLAASAAGLATIALLPTIAAVAAYWRLGALDAFAFANFASFFGKSGGDLSARLTGYAMAIGILSPLIVAALLPGAAGERGFLKAWMAAAVVGVLPFLNGPNPNSLPPLLLPLTLLAAPGLARRPRWTIALLAVIFVAGQAVLTLNQRTKGSAAQARALAAAATPRRGCLYVYDGYPALYHLTHSCLPTRYAFPGLLNTRSEASAAALGVDPTTEVARILATRPDKIADVQPAYARGNPATRALVDAAIARDYRRLFAVKTGAKTRIVYERR